MSIAICLIVFSFAIAILGPGALQRLTCEGVAPRLGLALWLAAMGSVIVSWVAALCLILIDVRHDLTHPGCREIVHRRVAELHDATTGAYGGLVQGMSLVLAGFGSIAALVAGVRLARALSHARVSTHEHARMVNLAGRHSADLGAVVLASDERAAYCVAGRQPTVVLTEGAVSALDRAQLAAVVAHERAHLRGRHHLLLAFTRGLAVVFPWFRLFTVGAAAVGRLLEMCADDVAVRIHGRDRVLAAMLAMSDRAGESCPATSSSRSGVSARVNRLSTVSTPEAQRSARARSTAAAVAAVIVPAIAAAITCAGIAVCMPHLSCSPSEPTTQRTGT